MLSRFDFSFKNKVQTNWFSGRRGAVFSNSLTLDFFLKKKSEILSIYFCNHKSLFTIPIRPYTHFNYISSSKCISDQHSSKL